MCICNWTKLFLAVWRAVLSFIIPSPSHSAANLIFARNRKQKRELLPPTTTSTIMTKGWTRRSEVAKKKKIVYANDMSWSFWIFPLCPSFLMFVDVDCVDDQGNGRTDSDARKCTSYSSLCNGDLTGRSHRFWRPSCSVDAQRIRWCGLLQMRAEYIGDQWQSIFSFRFIHSINRII